MGHLLSRFGPVLLVILIGSFGLTVAYRRSKARVSARSQRRSPLDYLLLWPILFESSSRADRSRRLLTNRELVGWLIVAALIVLGMALS
jgi:hypothetical protein